MANYKRKKPREKVRCRLCTDCRDNIGGDRARREKEAFDLEEVANAQPVAVLEMLDDA